MIKYIKAKKVNINVSSVSKFKFIYIAEFNRFVYKAMYTLAIMQYICGLVDIYNYVVQTFENDAHIKF